MIKPVDQIEAEEKSLMAKSAAVALGVYLALALIITRGALHAPTPAVTQEAPVVEAELVEPKEPPKLYEKTAPKAAPVVKTEATISKNLHQGHESADEMKKVMETSNQTVAAPPPAPPTHGPQLEYSPSPKLPTYLKNQNLKGSVLIEFFVSAKGMVTPNLIGSSGNDELDALALKTARTWIFKPAAKEGQPTDAKVRLRINFEVD